jgi:Ca2+-binding EF-hand superfamily protein
LTADKLHKEALTSSWPEFDCPIINFSYSNGEIYMCRCAKGDNATLSEFEEVLKAMNMSLLIPMAPRIFDLFDNNRDGTVDMREILCGFSSLRNSQGDDALRLCFQVCSLP